jgi:hypothetical protein
LVGAQNTLSGFVKAEGSLEPLPGVSIYSARLGKGTVTNIHGFYSLTLPEGKHQITIQFIGFNKVVKSIDFSTDQDLVIYLTESTDIMESVTIFGTAYDNVVNTSEMSTIRVPIETIQDMPAIIGERDVLKSLQYLPGVQSGVEGTSGFYVRGGGPDQNLILLDGATIYNPFHLLGFLSSFNGDVLNSVELIKGGFPARYGGRLSSVVNLSTKEGHKEEIHGRIGMGLLSSSIMLEGPMNLLKEKNKHSFVVSARRSWLDVLPRLVMGIRNTVSPEDITVGAGFHDLNAKLTFDLGPKDRLFISGYSGADNFKNNYKVNDDEFRSRVRSGMGWGNRSLTARWAHQYNSKTFGDLSLIYSGYHFGTNVRYDQRMEFPEADSLVDVFFESELKSSLNDIAFNADFDFLISPGYTLRMGAQNIYRVFMPTTSVSATSFDNEQDSIGINEHQSSNEINRSLETAFYVENQIDIGEAININAGFRLVNFFMGTKSYLRPEPRISTNFRLGANRSIKASYAQMNQFVHLLTSARVSFPTDLWVTSTDRIAPQRSWQVALGYAQELPKQKMTLTVEGYYKRSFDMIEYKPGASFLIDPYEFEGYQESENWEDKVTTAQGWAYGSEFLLRKNIGKITGWLGYTLSWNQRQSVLLNGGERYFAKFDRRHDASVVLNYKPHRNITLSGLWVYGTGARLTLPTYSRVVRSPLGGNNYGTAVSYYDAFDDYNNFKMEAYHRMDLSFQWHKEKKRGTRTWMLSVYNAYSRRNPFFYEYQSRLQHDIENGTREHTSEFKRIAIFPILPSVSYQFEFEF